jgi:hypothetical protein
VMAAARRPAHDRGPWSCRLTSPLGSARDPDAGVARLRSHRRSPTLRPRRARRASAQRGSARPAAPRRARRGSARRGSATTRVATLPWPPATRGSTRHRTTALPLPPATRVCSWPCRHARQGRPGRLLLPGFESGHDIGDRDQGRSLLPVGTARRRPGIRPTGSGRRK